MTTRRTLLTAGAVASALPSSLLAAALEDSSDALEPRQQVIVIGSGLAGLTAGASALESGARRVLILEKGPLVGGHSLYSSGSIAAVAPERAGAFSNGWRDSVEQFVADALAVGGGSGDPERLVQIARGSAAMLDWLEGLGVSFGRPFEARSDFIRAAGQCRAILPDGAMSWRSWTAIGVWAGKQSSRRRLKRLNGRNHSGRSA